jgi:hypothetical protein
VQPLGLGYKHDEIIGSNITKLVIEETSSVQRMLQEVVDERTWAARAHLGFMRLLLAQNPVTNI